MPVRAALPAPGAPKEVPVSMWRSILLFGLWASVVVPARAEPVNVVLGRTDCFVIRSPDGSEGIAARVARIHDVFARHAGRTPGRFTIRADGARRLISLDGEFLAAVTPADALATHHESAATLAPVWRDQLQRAWTESSPSITPTPPPRGPESAAVPRGGAEELNLLLVGALLLALLIVVAVVLRLGRQMTLMVRQSTDWQREVNETLLQVARTPPALPAGDAMLTPAVQSEIVRQSREQSQAAVGEAIQQICDSVERVMAGLLEELARGIAARPSGTEASREPVLAGGGRAAMPRPGAPANGGENSEPDGGSEPPTRRGPTALEITAYGKTYAFPMAPERARAVVEAWEKGEAVPEAWLHESGITTARLQPLLDRFVLRRQPADDGGTAYVIDPRGAGARFSVRSAP
jgi:hypothetical protein